MVSTIMEALRQLKNIDESVDNLNEDNAAIEIVKFPADEYCAKAGCEPGDFDWDDGRKAKFIYADKEETSAQVGIELEDGAFAVVGLHDDHICKDYADMVECIKFYM